MINLGMVKNVIDEETLQIVDFDDEIYEIKSSTLSVDEIKERMENDSSDIFVEYDDETMEMVV